MPQGSISPRVRRASYSGRRGGRSTLSASIARGQACGLGTRPADSAPVSVRNWPAFPSFGVECLSGRLRAQPEPLPGGQPATSFPIGRNRALMDYGAAFRWRAPRFEARDGLRHANTTAGRQELPGRGCEDRRAPAGQRWRDSVLAAESGRYRRLSACRMFSATTPGKWIGRLRPARHEPQRPRLDATFQLLLAPVAQTDRASAFEADGRGFESLRARHSRQHPPTPTLTPQRSSCHSPSSPPPLPRRHRRRVAAQPGPP